MLIWFPLSTSATPYSSDQWCRGRSDRLGPHGVGRPLGINSRRKEKLHGTARVNVGSGGEKATDNDGPRNDAKKEPAFYLSFPVAFYESLFSTWGIKAVINLCAGEGNAEVACCELGIPIVSVTHTEDHVTMLYSRIASKVFQKTQCRESRLFERRLKAVIDDEAKTNTELKPTPKPKNKSRKTKDAEASEEPPPSDSFAVFRHNFGANRASRDVASG